MITQGPCLEAYPLDIPFLTLFQQVTSQHLGRVPLRRLHCKQSACFMVFSVRPIYRHLATSGHPENGSKLNFAMEPSEALRSKPADDEELVPVMGANVANPLEAA